MSDLISQNLNMIFKTPKGETVHALKDVNFTLKKGELLTVLGPSGCGKTTLLNITAGFLRPTSGQIILGGSTNAVLHLIAMADAVGVPLTLDDFQKMSDETPLLADLKPSGKYLMEDLHAVGGIPAVMKFLLEKGLLHGECMTVTGKTLAENGIYQRHSVG